MGKILSYFFLILTLLLVLAYGGYLAVANSVEKPDYAVVVAEDGFEIRDYPPMIVAEVTTRGDRQSAISAGFRPLAAYIFASERDGGTIAMTAPVTQDPKAPEARDKIAMTAPVTQTPSGAGEREWTVRFIMPAEYTMETLPRPANAQVRLVEIPARRRAAVRFSGYPSDELFEEKEAALRAWLDGRSLTPAGSATYAYYNDPFTPGFMRRNEVLFDLGDAP
ncbi:MAG: heme-binding protein [Alphaproteobacteria bacterium]